MLAKKVKVPSKLGKLPMPAKRQEEDLSDLDQAEADPMDDQSAGEMDDAGMDVADDGAGQKDPAADLSDDDLMAEVKKRGLMAKLTKGEESAEGESGDNSQDAYS